MKLNFYKYNAVDDAMIAWNKNFTSRIGDGNGDPEEEYLSAVRLIARCKNESTFFDIGSGLGRLIGLVKGKVPKIIGLEPDKKRFDECYRTHHDGFSVNVLNIGSHDYRAENVEDRFDFIAVSMVLQHVTTSMCKEILSDVRELLSSTGVAIISTTQQDEERFTFQTDSKPKSAYEFDQYTMDCENQKFGIPVRQFSKQSFLNEISRAGLSVVQWGQFSYILPEKLAWMAKWIGTSEKAIRDVGTSQYAIVERS